MKKIKSEIRGCMELEAPGAGVREASFLFPPEFVAFQGHFPGMPVLPGACQIQCLLSMLEALSGKSLALKEIVLAKYIAPVLPNETITVRLSEPFDPDAPESVAKATILRDGAKVSELRIRTSLRENQPR